MPIRTTTRLHAAAAFLAGSVLSTSMSMAASGTWLGTSGDWSDTAIWSGGTVADGTGFTANFTGVDITADQTINLDTSRTIGGITFTDATTASHNLLISGSGVLTLDVASGDAIISSTNRTLTISSQISGSDGLRKNGVGGTLVLSGNNNYTGLTLVSGGNLLLQHANGLGSIGALNSTTVNTSGRLQLQGGLTYAAESLTLVTSTSGTVIPLQNISGNNEWTGSLTPSGGGSGHLNRIQSDADTLTLSGPLGSVGAGSRYALQGAGNITISGQITGSSGIISGTVGSSSTSVRALTNDANNYTSATGVSGGVLSFTSIANVGGGASALGAPTTAATGTIGIGSGTVSGVLRYTGSGHTSDRVISLAGDTGGATIESSGSGALVLTSATTATGAGSKTLTLGGTNTGNNSIGAIVNNSLTNTTSVVKADAGKWILAGSNTYTGTTTVSAGALIVNGSIASSSSTTVASGATLGGDGTTGALSISSGGFVSPGNSAGILWVSGNLSLAANATYTAEINGLTAGSLHDQISVTGAVDVSGGVLSPVFTGSYSLNDMVFLLLNDGGDAITGTFSGLSQGAIAATYGGYDWEISYLADSVGGTFTGGNDIGLRAVAIPEPGAALMAGLGLLGVLRRRRADSHR